MEIHIGTGEHMCQIFPLNIVLLNVFFHPRQRQCPGRLRHCPHIIKQIFHSCADGVTVHHNHIIQILLT